MVAIPRSALPASDDDVAAALRAYFSFDLFPYWERDGDFVQVRLEPPPAIENYVDPDLMEGLHWWGPDTTVQDIPSAGRGDGPASLWMNDAWTLYRWSSWLEKQRDRPARLVVLHIDDHEDLASPRLIVTDEGLEDLITGQPVRLREPATVQAAIRSGAIGMGSFIAPLLHHMPDTEIRHLRARTPALPPTPIRWGSAADTLLRPGAPRLTLVRGDPASDVQGTYMRTSDPMSWAAEISLDSTVLLHIDLDYFNNRYDCDTDWRERPSRHDPDLATVLRMVDDVFDSLEETYTLGRIEDVATAISPGFFPSELWGPTITRIDARLSAGFGGR
ncbi:MAG: hypothetical protein JWN67_2333 [Actinomycetia bacterium]|nr:hypothetical protein [Actinomycetes bacterium]